MRSTSTMSTPMPRMLIVKFQARCSLQPIPVCSKAPEGWRTPRRFASWKTSPNMRQLLECGRLLPLLYGPRKECPSADGTRTETNSDSSIDSAHSPVVVLHECEHFAHGIFPAHKNCA